MTLDHYRALFGERDFWTPIRNSLVVAGTTTLLCVTLGSLAAYALARLDSGARRWCSAFILAVTMFPQISIVSPLYLLLRALHLINTYPGSDPAVPHLRDAAHGLAAGRILPPAPAGARGGGHGRRRRAGSGRFREVILPLALPGIATTAILTFVYCWNEFLFALSFTLGPERQTVPVAIALFRGQYQVPWGQILAAAVVATAPVAVLVLASSAGSCRASRPAR